MKAFFVKYKKLFIILIVLLVTPYLLFREILPAIGVGRTFSNPTKAMTPTLNLMDLVFVNQLSSADTVTDVVAYKAADSKGIMRDYLSRIVAKAGDVISVKHNSLLINGVTNSDASFYLGGYYRESWLANCKEEYTLASDEFFLIGDNVKVSYDSRSHGPVKRHDIIGKYSFKLNSIRFFLFTFIK